MNLIIDMNLSPRWVVLLAKHGVSAEHWTTIGKPDASDREIMDYAREHKSIVLTNDLDFGAILAATGGQRPSVIQLRSDDLRPESNVEYIARTLKQESEELERGALLTVLPSKARLRILPLGPA